MGFLNFIKKSFLVILCIVLLISFIAMNALFVISSSLEYNYIQSSVKPILKDVIFKDMDKAEFEKNFEAMKLYCQQNNTEYVLFQDNNVITIQCSDILNGTSESIVDLQIDKFIQDNYYKKYECSFIQCFKSEKPLFFVLSESTYNYFNSKFYISILISLILIALIFFLVEFKRNVLTLIGILLILSSLPFAKFNLFTGLITDTNILNILTLVFAKAYTIFLISFVLGILFLGAGIGLKIWGNKETNIKTRKNK